MSVIMHIGHAVTMILCISPFAIYKTVKANDSERNALHPVSGLPAVNQLSYSEKDSRPLIVANIVEFEELMGILDPLSLIHI